jgi:ABC-2 type transport system ATP-binding protein
MSQQPAVEATGLHKAYGAVSVLDGVDLCVPRGNVLALLGPNGAGKTTTVRILSTLIRADAGVVRVAGFDAVAERREVRRRISLTGQDVAIDELLTGAENLQMVARLRGLDRRATRRLSAELLERFDLVEAADRRTGTYSGGMRRRLDLAAGLLADPEVIFLDEPTTGLDLRSRQAVWDAVRHLVATGASVVLTTQYLEEADQLADRVAVLEGGRIVADGTPAELKRRVAEQRLELTLTDEEAFSTALLALGERAVHADRGELAVAVPTDGSAADVRATLAHVDPDGAGIARFALHEASLDDVFLSLTGHATHEPEQETADV